MSSITLFSVVLAYLLGSLSFAVLVSRAMKLADPRAYGSGNPGATNVLRSGSKLAAILTLVGDTLKAILAMVIARCLQVDDTGLALTAMAAAFGHMWPVFFGFKGGKGVATSAGILLVIDWRLGLLTIVVWLLMAITTRYSSLSALAASVAAPIFSFWLMPTRPAIFGAVLMIAAVLIYRHVPNLRNLWHGRESKIGAKSSG